MVRIALIADYDAGVTAHRAIPPPLDIAARALAVDCEPQWIHRSAIYPAALTGFDAIRRVPPSPQADGDAVIGATEIARRRGIPFLGSCACYQHALPEFAGHESGSAGAAGSEDDPDTAEPKIHALSCSLIDVSEPVTAETATVIDRFYGEQPVAETYHCRFDVNPRYLPRFAGSSLRFGCRDRYGQPRAFELDDHRFFFVTAFQPERAAVERKNHPLIAALFESAL